MGIKFKLYVLMSVQFLMPASLLHESWLKAMLVALEKKRTTFET